MKKIIFYTLIGLVGTIVVTTLFNLIFGFELQSFSLWFVIPVGGIYVGIGAVSGLYYYYFKHKDARSLNWKVYLVSFVLGFVAFLEYTTYHI